MRCDAGCDPVIGRSHVQLIRALNHLDPIYAILQNPLKGTKEDQEDPGVGQVPLTSSLGDCHVPGFVSCAHLASKTKAALTDQ